MGGGGGAWWQALAWGKGNHMRHTPWGRSTAYLGLLYGVGPDPAMSPPSRPVRVWPSCCVL